MAPPVVGLDIGSSGVRAVELSSSGRRTSVRRFARRALPDGVVRAGVVVDEAALSGHLEELWREGRFRTRAVRLGIANAGVLVRQLDLDWMAPADFRKALRYQVQDVLPFSVDEANLDHHLLEELEVPAPDGGTRRVSRILLVAAAREMVDGFVRAAEGAKLRVEGVDLTPFALIRARTRLAEAAPVSEAVIDIGADVISVAVHHQGVPQYVRMVPGLGGDTVTRAIQEHWDWSWEDAERTKVYVGLPGHAHLDDGQRQAVGPARGGLDHAAQRVVDQAVAGLVDEIEATLSFYRDGRAEDRAGDETTVPVGRVLLCGGGARLGGLAEVLGARLGVPVEHLELLDGLRSPRRPVHPVDAATLAPCAGLGLGAAS